MSKRRTWRKPHLAVDEATGEMFSAVVTDNSCQDSGTTPRRFAALGNAYQDSGTTPRRFAALGNAYQDSEVLGELLDEIDEPISQVDADGAYDTAYCHDYIEERGAVAGIPPPRNAKIWFHSNCQGPRHSRDESLRKIRLAGRAKWKRQIGYHRCSLAETTIFRLKTAFGGSVTSRQMNRQVNEVKVQSLVLNRMIQVAKPDSSANWVKALG